MIHTFKFAAAALVGLTLTACQGSVGTPSTISSGTPKTSPTRSELLTTRGAQTAVEGRDYTTLYTVDPRGKSGARIGVLTIRDDSSAVIANDPLGAPADSIVQSQVGIQSGHSRKWFPIQTGSRPREAFEAATHGQSVVWIEETQVMRASVDRKVFAIRAGQNKPTLISDASDLAKSDVIPTSPGGNLITTDGVHAWWVLTYSTKTQRGWGARIVVRDLAGHESITTAVDKARNPIATRGGIAYIRSNDVAPGMSANRYEIRFRHGQTDTLITSGPLVKDEQVSAMCATDTLLAWAVRSPSGTREHPDPVVGALLHVMTLATKAEKIVQLDDRAGGVSLGCGDTFVAWGNGSGNGDPGQYVLDVSTNKIWKLGELRGISAVLTAGSILAWALPPKSAQEAAPWRVTKWHGA